MLTGTCREKTGSLMGSGDERECRNARWVFSVLVGAGICAAPALLWGGAWKSYFLHLDDWVYLSGSRTGQALVANLFRPHNAHVVPFFRVETFLLSTLAGRLHNLPTVLGLANYATLILAMLGVGHLAAHETRRTAIGLGAMAAVGLSTVLGPAVLWYAASQALMAGVLVVLMLVALQEWRNRGGWAFLVVAGLAAIAAPLCWSAGYAAGPTALAYLWPGGKRGPRIVGVIFLASSVLVGSASWTVLGPDGRKEAGEGLGPLIGRIPAGAGHTAQAIPEILVLNNLGLDARTEEIQGRTLCALVLAAWYVSSLRSRRAARTSGPTRAGNLVPGLSPLEAAGAMLVLVDFGMVYTARGGYTFENLRPLGWYHAMPQLGAVLIAAGWWAGGDLGPGPRPLNPPTLRELGWVLGIAAVLILLQWPRAQRVLFDYDGAAAPVGGEGSGASRPAGAVSLADLTARAASQRKVLARLDRLEEFARAKGIGRSGLRRVLGRVMVPGMPDVVPDLDAVGLLRIPETGRLDDADDIRAAIDEIMRSE